MDTVETPQENKGGTVEPAILKEPPDTLWPKDHPQLLLFDPRDPGAEAA